MVELGREQPLNNWMSSPLEAGGPAGSISYPGLGGETAETNAFLGGPSPASVPASVPSPFSPVQVMPAAAAPQAAASPLKGLLNNFSLNDLKGMLDRMGGVEGLLSNVGKVQKFMTTFQQMAPLIKLFMGKKGSGSSDDASSGASYRPRRRRRKRRSSSKLGAKRTGGGRGNSNGSRRRKGGSGSKRRTGRRR